MAGKNLSYGEKALQIDASVLAAFEIAHEEAGADNRGSIPPCNREKAAWTCLAAISAGDLSSTVLWWTTELRLVTGFGTTQGASQEQYFSNPPCDPSFGGNRLAGQLSLLKVDVGGAA